MNKIDLPWQAHQVLIELQNAGYEAFVVGGCVRDSLLGIAPKDWDICTSATPEQVIEAFKNYKIIKTGIKHGTVTVVFDDAHSYEITTYRVDGEYKDNRHPDSVKFASSLKEDLARRDFTINAMAYAPRVGLVDYFGGLVDLYNGIVRCVGDPNQRFNEDGLRILRAIRFSLKYNFEIDAATREAMLQNKHLLHNISKERIHKEIVDSMYYGLTMDLAVMIQELVPAIPSTHLPKIVRAAIRINKGYYPAPMLALLFDFDSEDIKKYLRQLKFSNKEIKIIIKTREWINTFIELVTCPSLSDIKVLVKTMLIDEPDVFDDVLDALYGFAYATDNHTIGEIGTKIEQCRAECYDECHNYQMLNINGDDLKELGFVGKEIGTMKRLALLGVIQNWVDNDKVALSGYVMGIKSCANSKFTLEKRLTDN